MKRMAFISVFVFIVLLMVGCGENGYGYEHEGDYHHHYEEDYEYEYEHEEEFVFESVIPLDMALRLFTELEEIWDRDGGALWGVPLHAPVMIACRTTRQAVGNQPDLHGILTPYGGVYVGELPPGAHISNTALWIGGIYWGMAIWDDAQSDLDTLVTLNHEAYHAILGGGFAGPDIEVLGGNWVLVEDINISWALEMDALLSALRSTGDARLEYVTRGLSYRAWRRYQRPPLTPRENSVHYGEGLAQYSDHIVFEDLEDFIAHRIVPWIDHALEGEHGNGINYGYAGGALYALLLNETGIDWKTDRHRGMDFGDLLKNAMGITELIPFDLLVLERRGE